MISLSSALSNAGPAVLPDNDFSTLAFPLLAGGARAGRDDDRAELERQWRARGHAAGYTAGLRAAAEESRLHQARLDAEHNDLMRSAGLELDRALAVLQAAARALDRRTAPVLQDAEDSMLTIAMELAEAIVGHTLADEYAAVRFAVGRIDAAVGVQGASPAAPAGSGHTVRLHPEDLAVLDPAHRDRAGVTFVADAGLARGDAISEFPDGYIDARIQSALERAKAALGAGAS